MHECICIQSFLLTFNFFRVVIFFFEIDLLVMGAKKCFFSPFTVIQQYHINIKSLMRQEMLLKKWITRVAYILISGSLNSFPLITSLISFHLYCAIVQVTTHGLLNVNESYFLWFHLLSFICSHYQFFFILKRKFNGSDIFE